MTEFFLQHIWQILIGFLVFVLVLRFFVVNLREIRVKKMETTVLQIQVSRDSEKGPIVAEQMFASLYGIFENYSWWDRFWGKVEQQLSFEIANVEQKIRFYAWMPLRFKTLVESQLYAQYPDIEIKEIKDYAKKGFVAHENPKIEKNVEGLVPYDGKEGLKTAICAEMELDDPYIYPIKRYTQFEDKLTRKAVDPLSGITASLTRLNATDEQAWIQLVIRPINDKWRKRGIKLLRILAKGFAQNNFWLNKRFSKIYLSRGFVTRLLNAPLRFVFWVFGARGAGTLSSVVLDENDPNAEELKEEMSAQHDRETGDMAAMGKITKLGFEANLRIVYVPRPENHYVADVKLKEIVSSLQQFSLPQLNKFVIRTFNQKNNLILRRFQQRSIVNPIILNTEEVATIFHLPNETVINPNIDWVTSKKMESPLDLPQEHHVPANEFTLLGRTNFRGEDKEFGMKLDDRRRHVYIIGKTGMGKSTLLENMVFSDIQNGKGVAVIDPHGDLAEAVIDFVPKNRSNDLVVFDPSDTGFPVSFNMLEARIPEQRPLVASGLLGVFKKLYADSWGPRLEHILRNTILALIEFPNTSMLGIPRMLVDKDFRRKVVKNVTDPMVKSFWVDEFEKMPDRQRTEAISPIQNKVGQFLSSPVIRNIVGQVKSSLDLRFAMDRGKIVVVNLSKGKIGEDNSALLGAMMITKFQLDAMSRADILEKDRRDFYLYVDEFQNFATDSFATILSEARKYRLNLTMANQYIEQMSDEVRSAVFGNVGTLITFQVGYDDAAYFEQQFSEDVSSNDIVALPKYQIYTKLMIDGMPSRVFSAATLPPPEIEEDEARREKLIRLSRERYAVSRDVVEDKIRRWSEVKVVEKGKKDVKVAPKKQGKQKVEKVEKKLEKKENKKEEKNPGKKSKSVQSKSQKTSAKKAEKKK